MLQAALLEEIKNAVSGYTGKWNEKKGLWDFSTIIAERKAFLSTKKLSYAFKLRIDESARVVRFSEMLTETGSGFSSGGLDDGISSFGVKSESYNTFKGPRQGTIQEQSNLFGKDYTYRFNYQEVSSRIKDVVERSGFRFEYQVLPVK